MTFLAALMLATVSAGFSIVGLISIFAGAFWPVIALGAAFELGKLVAAAWIGRARFPLSVALSGLVLALMVLNSIGVYGFLPRAHIATALAGDLAVAARAAGIDARLDAEQATLADIDRRIADRPQTETKTKTDRGPRQIMQTSTTREPVPVELERQRSAALDAVTDLKVQKANSGVERKTTEAELGPLKYLAALIGTSDEVIMRYFILAVALLLDPAAVLLLIAATRRGSP